LANTESWLELYAAAAKTASPTVGITSIGSPVLLVLVFKIAANAARIDADVINEMKVVRMVQFDSSLVIFDDSVKVFNVVIGTFNPIIRRVGKIAVANLW
jgi:hypothetical protein